MIELLQAVASTITALSLTPLVQVVAAKKPKQQRVDPATKISVFRRKAEVRKRWTNQHDLTVYYITVAITSPNNDDQRALTRDWRQKIEDALSKKAFVYPGLRDMIVKPSRTTQVDNWDYEELDVEIQIVTVR